MNDILILTSITGITGIAMVFMSWYKQKQCFRCGINTYWSVHRHCMKCDILYCSNCAKNYIGPYYVPPTGTGLDGPIGMCCKDECIKLKLDKIYQRLCLIKLQRLWIDKMYKPYRVGYNNAHKHFTQTQGQLIELNNNGFSSE